MTAFETSRQYRPDPSRVGQPESWGKGRATAELTANAIVITAAGEFDASNAEHLAVYVQRRAGLAAHVYLDLREVTFFGTIGLAILRRLEHQFDTSGLKWHLLAGPAVKKLLRICHATDLPQLDTLDHVLGRREPAALTPAV